MFFNVSKFNVINQYWMHKALHWCHRHQINAYADNWQRFDTASIAQMHSLALKYLKAPNMDLKAFKSTLTLKVLYFAATLPKTIIFTFFALKSQNFAQQLWSPIMHPTSIL